MARVMLPPELAEAVEHPEALTEGERERMRADVGRLAGLIAPQ
jgi:hypothetical protein